MKIVGRNAGYLSITHVIFHKKREKKREIRMSSVRASVKDLPGITYSKRSGDFRSPGPIEEWFSSRGRGMQIEQRSVIFAYAERYDLGRTHLLTHGLSQMNICTYFLIRFRDHSSKHQKFHGITRTWMETIFYYSLTTFRRQFHREINENFRETCNSVLVKYDSNNVFLVQMIWSLNLISSGKVFSYETV